VITREKQPIPESQKRVLIQIAEKGPQTKYEIEKQTGVNHASIHEIVNAFVKAGLLKDRKTGVTRVGLPKRTYSLTLHGLCAVIGHLKEHSLEIIEKWAHLEPVFFGRSKYLMEKVGKEEVQRVFRTAARQEFDFNMKNVPYNVLSELFFDPHDPSDLADWIEAFSGDPELRRLGIEYLESMIRQYRDELECFVSVLNSLTKPEAPC
jgi:DNA-binding MarR family transcriptional regulator